MPVDFKALLKSYRLRAGYGLREFAEMIGEAPSNYSGVESGARAPWRPLEKLRVVAEALGLREGGADWDAFYISARKNGALPPDMEHLLDRPLIPVLLRTVDEMKLSDADLLKLVEELQKKSKGVKK